MAFEREENFTESGIDVRISFHDGIAAIFLDTHFFDVATSQENAVTEARQLAVTEAAQRTREHQAERVAALPDPVPSSEGMTGDKF